MSDEDRSKLVSYAGRILSARPYFADKLKLMLLERAKQEEITDLSVIDSIIEELSQAGYLNDSFYANSFAESESKKGKSPRQIYVKLQSRGLSSSVINQVLRDLPESIKKEAVSKVISKYHKDPKGLKSHLLKYGFDQNIIRKVLGNGYSNSDAENQFDD